MLKVSEERWRQAQEWEAATWNGANMNTPRVVISRFVKKALGLYKPDLGNDHNDWWAARMDDYAALPASWDNHIEVGCGPYTNTRLILENRQVKHVFCSDPLIKNYITYNERWLSKAWRAGRVLIDDHALEDCPFASDYFDTTVMINVLDHVRDATACIEHVMRITKPGGFLVIGQDLCSPEDAARHRGDIGHSIRVTHDVLDGHLLPSFDPKLRRVLSREEGRGDGSYYGTYLFIGQKHALETRQSGDSV